MTGLVGLIGAPFVVALRGLESEHARLQWESLTVSNHSPGPVADSEEVVRCCDTPVHISPDGTLTPAAFSDVEDIGMSVHRSTIHDDAALWAAADRRLAERQALRLGQGKPADNRHAMALARLRACDLRGLHHTDSARMFGVYDTGLLDDPSHADVVCLHAEKQRVRSARARLYGLARVTMRQRGSAATTGLDAPGNQPPTAPAPG